MTTTAEEKKQTLGTHLVAMRKMLVVSAAAIAITFLLLFYALREPLVYFILNPVKQRGIEVIATAVSEALMMQFKTCLVAALVKEAADTVAGRLAEKQLTLLTEQDGARISCDRDLMLALLQNLLQNAIKASAPGGRIWLSGSAQGFTVRDEGEGIAPEHLPHVTEAFYMADKSRARSQQGAGLGLALVHRIAQLHGASLLIDSQPGQGTIVTLSFTSP